MLHKKNSGIRDFIENEKTAKLNDKWLNATEEDLKDPAFLVDVAVEAMGGQRLPEEIEEHLLTIEGDFRLPYELRRYAEFVLKSRWPEAEGIIAQDEINWYHYQRNVCGNRDIPMPDSLVNTKSFYKNLYKENYFESSKTYIKKNELKKIYNKLNDDIIIGIKKNYTK